MSTEQLLDRPEVSAIFCLDKSAEHVRERGAGAALVWGASSLLSNHPFPGLYHTEKHSSLTEYFQCLPSFLSRALSFVMLFFCFSNYMEGSSD